MEATIWVAIITQIGAVVGVIITVLWGNKKQAKNNKDYNDNINKSIEGYKDLTVYRIEQLEKKQDLHNKVIERVFIGEGKIAELQHEMKDVKRELREMTYGEKQ